MGNLPRIYGYGNFKDMQNEVYKSLGTKEKEAGVWDFKGKLCNSQEVEKE